MVHLLGMFSRWAIEYIHGGIFTMHVGLCADMASKWYEIVRQIVYSPGSIQIL